MAYSKTKWVNNQTKLSATNLNHMEQGILDAHDLVDEAKRDAAEARETGLEAQALAREAQDAIEHIDLSSKQDVLESGVNIKTINGQGILGSGDLVIKEDEDVNYQELPDGTSLDSVVETGIYSLKHANNFPVGTDEEGTLTVTKLDDQKVEQEWKSKVNNAQRILEIGKGSGNLFKVNGEVRPQGVVRLSAGNTYELEGNLIGNVIIEGASSTLNRTKLILKGVNIQSDEAESIINYTPEVSKLVIEVANNTENYLVCNIDEETGEDDLGVVNSENNLMLTGVGYLTIINKKGHGVKASELIIDGDLHMYLDTNHDAIHGGKLLKITNGYFEVKNANDAFSASSGGSGTGKLLIYGGTYIINACKESAFEGKSPNGVKRILNANITFGEGVNKLFNASNASSPAYQVKVYQGLNSIENNSGKTYTEVDMADDFTGEPTIVFGGEVNIEPVSGVFTLNQPGDYKLSGNFSNYRIISAPPAGDNKMNFILDNVYYNNTEESAPFIEHTSTDKRIKFDSESKDFLGKLCYIRKAKGDIIRSGKNIQFDGKTDVIIDGCSDDTTCGLRTPNGYVALLNDSLRRIQYCNYGIEADNVRLGKDPDDVLDGKYTTGDAEIYLLNNGLDIKLTKQGAYEQYHSLVVAPQYHTGISIIGQVAGNDVKIEAQSGLIQGANYTNSAILYLELASGTQTNVNRYNPPVGVKATVPSIDPSESSTWNVYKGDGYSQSEADNRFVSKTAYDAVVAQLKAISPVYAHFSVAPEDVEKIAKVHIHKYACPERFDDEPEGYKVSNGKLNQATIIARDGDFGYHAIDGTGQVNFTVEFADDYKNGYVVIPEILPIDSTVEKPYGNFKSKYSTGLNCPLGTAYDYQGLVSDGIYRITKITTDLNVILHVYKESELSAHTITYNINNPDNVNAVVTVYRCADGIEKVAKYGVYDSTLPVSESNPKNGYPKEFKKVLAFENNVAIDYTYADGSGFRSNATYADGAACLQFTVTGLPEGYKATASISGGEAKKDYSKFEYATDFGGYFSANKVGKDLTVTITVSDAVNVSYVKPEGAYEFDAEVLPTASKRADFTFDVYYNLDKSNNNENKQLLPDPAALLDRIASITSDSTALTAGEDYYIDYAVDSSKFQTYSQGTKPNKVEWWILNDGKFAQITGGTAESYDYGHFDGDTFVVESTKTENELESLKVTKYSKGLSGKKVTITIDHTKITGDIVITTAVPE